MHVLIAGGGLGGLCLAHALRAAGLSVAVFERQPAQPEPLLGYRIHIDQHGSQALHDCLPASVWDAFVDRSGRPPRGIAFATQDLRRLAFIEEPSPGLAAVARAHPISRAGLRSLLLTGLDDVVTFDRGLVGYEQLASGQVVARFADGSQAQGDVLVGADGAGSAVRRQLLPHAQVVDTGIAGIAGKVSLVTPPQTYPDTLLDQMTMVLPPRAMGMFVAAFRHLDGYVPGSAADLPDHLFWALLGRPAALGLDGGTLRHDGASLRQAASARVATWHPLLRRLVAESDPATILSVPIHSAEPVAAWRPSNVTLLGDAIHTMTPLQGLGGNTALRDAALLSQNLADAHHGRADLLGAIGAYQAAMLEYGFQAVHQSLQIAQQVASSSQVARLAFKSVLRVADQMPPLRKAMFR